TPRLTPAPASQVTNVPPLWSRPVAPWVNGMRPNSVVQMTNVSSSRPRCFRSPSSAAIGLSTLRAMKGSSVAMSLWLSQLVLGPVVLVQFLEERKPLCFALPGDVRGRRGRPEVGNGHCSAGLDDHSLVGHRQETGREIACLVVGQAARIREHDKGGKVVAQA